MHSPSRVIRALFDDSTITIYQAYNKTIADNAVRNQTFVSPFKVERMTWIKPSFLWMMYRCGWALKEQQEHVLAIQITREGFEWALRHSCLSHFDPTLYMSHDEWQNIKERSPVRVQWDPERDINLQPLAYRSLQVGLSGEAVSRYIREWIVQITDITPLCKQIHHHILAHNREAAITLLPQEIVYPIPPDISTTIGVAAEIR